MTLEGNPHCGGSTTKRWIKQENGKSPNNLRYFALTMAKYVWKFMKLLKYVSYVNSEQWKVNVFWAMKPKASKDIFVMSTSKIRNIYMRNGKIRIGRNKRTRKCCMNLLQCQEEYSTSKSTSAMQNSLQVKMK